MYGKSDFVERLVGAGFLMGQFGAAFFGGEVLQRNGVSKRSCLYVVSKTDPPALDRT